MTVEGLVPGPRASPSQADGELEQWLARYGRERRPREDRPPVLQDALRHLARLPRTRSALCGLPPSCRCLIEGHAAPDNAETLRDFLRGMGVDEAEIVAVELLDLPAVYRQLGWAWPRMQFRIADACQLQEVAGDRAFDVVVQESLLNCVPPVRSARLLAEAARVLAPRGRALVSFTDSSCLAPRPTMSPEEAARRLGTPWDPTARHLSELVPDAASRRDLMEELAGSVILDRSRGHHTLVTAPFGRFEFFVPLSDTKRQLAEAGFEILVMADETGPDDHGLSCVRHRAILASGR